MALFKAKATIDAMLDLLEREYALILEGKCEKLALLLPEKERLISELSTSDQHLPQLAHLKAKADRNQTLLLAAARGIKAGCARIKEIQSAPNEFRLYSDTGQSREVRQKKPIFERRA